MGLTPCCLERVDARAHSPRAMRSTTGLPFKQALPRASSTFIYRPTRPVTRRQSFTNVEHLVAALARAAPRARSTSLAVACSTFGVVDGGRVDVHVRAWRRPTAARANAAETPASLNAPCGCRCAPGNRPCVHARGRRAHDVQRHLGAHRRGHPGLRGLLGLKLLGGVLGHAVGRRQRARTPRASAPTSPSRRARRSAKLLQAHAYTSGSTCGIRLLAHGAGCPPWTPAREASAPHIRRRPRRHPA